MAAGRAAVTLAASIEKREGGPYRKEETVWPGQSKRRRSAGSDGHRRPIQIGSHRRARAKINWGDPIGYDEEEDGALRPPFSFDISVGPHRLRILLGLSSF